jgi:exoribonuclease-2
VVRFPKRWGRIVDIAAQHGYQLPKEPGSKALSIFLTHQKTADPLRFPDLSLVIIKLLGSGEYVVHTDVDKGYIDFEKVRIYRGSKLSN